MAAALGPVHPVARIMADIADRNASPATKARAELRRQQVGPLIPGVHVFMLCSALLG